MFPAWFPKSQLTTVNLGLNSERFYASDKEIQDTISRDAKPQMQAETRDMNSVELNTNQQLRNSSGVSTK